MVNVKNDKFGSIIFQGKDEDLRVNEGDSISFVIESTGELREGTLSKICGSKKERALAIHPKLAEYLETWSILSIAENSLKVTKKINDEE